MCVPQDPAPVGWFLLSIVTSVEGSRTSPAVLSLAAALKARGDNSSKSLDIVLLGASLLSDTGGAGPPAVPAANGAGLVALEDLRLQPGGRHNNDHTDYRSISIMITSEEVGGWAQMHACEF